MKNRKEPEIRFPGFGEDWEERKLGDSIKVIDGDRGSNYPHNSDFFESGDTLFLDTGNVTKNGFKFDNIKYISEEKDKQLRSGKLEKNDFVLTSRGTLGNVGFYNESVYKFYPKLRINSAMLILRNTDEQLSYHYLHTLLKGKLISDFMRKNQVGSAQPHITKTEFLKLDLNIPNSIKEQNKIGDFFEQLDDTIALHQQELSTLKQTKQGFLKKMFPKEGKKVPEIRFPGFIDDWEQRKLGDIYKKNGERNNGQFKYKKTISIASMRFKPEGNGASEESLDGYKVLRIGDIAYEGHKSKIFSFGRFVLNDIGDGIMSPRFTTLRPIKPMNIQFWKQYIIYEPIMKHILVKSTKLGTMMNELVVADFFKLKIFVPSDDEQILIGTFFKQLDDTIALHQRELELLQATKKAFLQKMFV